MRFKINDFTGEPKIVGVKNGISQLDIVLPTNKSERLQYLLSLGGGIYDNETIRIDKLEDDLIFRLKPSAKITDLMFFSPFINQRPYLVSEKIKSIFDKYKLYNTYIKKVTLVSKTGIEQPENFYMVQTQMVLPDEIDFSNTTFKKWDYPNLESLKKRYQFKNIGEYLNRETKDQLFHLDYIPVEIHFKMKEMEDADLIKSINGTYVSDELASELNSAGLTNIECI